MCTRRTISAGLPACRKCVNLLDGVQFLQAKDRIIIIYQRDHQVRWVWLNREHSANPAPSWYGELVGHYEGDELVIDTIGLKTHKMSVVDAFGTPAYRQAPRRRALSAVLGSVRQGA